MRKTIVLALFACVLSLGINAQTDSLELSQAFYGYLKTVDDKDPEATADMLYPKMFELMSREDMVDIMQQMYEDKKMEIKFENSKLKRIGEAIENEGSKYVAIDYEYQMTFIYKARYLKKNMKNVASVLIEERGEENVKVDKKNHTIIIQSDKTLIAIADPSYDGWSL